MRARASTAVTFVIIFTTCSHVCRPLVRELLNSTLRVCHNLCVTTEYCRTLNFRCFCLDFSFSAAQCRHHTGFRKRKIVIPCSSHMSLAPLNEITIHNLSFIAKTSNNKKNGNPRVWNKSILSTDWKMHALNPMRYCGIGFLLKAHGPRLMSLIVFIRYLLLLFTLLCLAYTGHTSSASRKWWQQ